MTPRFSRSPFPGALLAFALWAVSDFCAADAAQAARYYEDALARYEKKDDAGAIIQLKNALQQDPLYLPAHLLIGQALLRKGDLGAAEVALSKALQMGADRSEVLSQLAAVYLALGKHKDLLEKIRPTGLPPTVAAELWLARAYSALALGDFTGADVAISTAGALTPNSAKVAMARGTYYLRRDNFTDAQTAVDQAIKLDAHDPRAWNLKGAIAHAKGSLSAALDSYSRALSLDPGYLDVRIARAGILLDINRLDEAEKDLNLLEEKHPEEARAAYLRAVYLTQKNDTKRAKAELLLAAKGISALPQEYINTNPQLLMLATLSNYGLQAYERAQSYIAAYISLRPSDPGARKLLGNILLARGQADAAITQLEYAHRAAPNDPQALHMLASAYLKANQHVKAANLLEQAGSAVLQSPALTSSLGFSLIGVGRQAQGLEYLTQAYAKNPANFRLGSVLVMFNIQRGRPAESVRIAEAYRSKVPKDPAAYNLLGVAYSANNAVQSARTAYEKALSLAPNFPAAHLNLGKLLAAQQQFDAARRHFHTVLKLKANHPQAQFELGLAEFAAGRSEEALRWLKAAHGQNTANISVAIKLVDVYLQLGQAENALTLAKQTTAQVNDNFDALSALARSYAATQRDNLATSTLANMSKLAGYNVNQLTTTAHLQLRMGDIPGATLSLNKALGEHPGALEANVLMAELEGKKGQAQSGLDRLKRLAKTNPDSALAQRSLGDLAMGLRQMSLAIQAYRTALQLENTSQNAVAYSMALAQGAPDQAIAFLENWSRQHPQASDSQLALADLYLRSGHWAKARGAYEGYLKQRGEHPVALNNYANVLMQQGDNKALSIAQRAYALAPDAAPVNDTLGWLLFKAGNNDAALRHLREARSRAPDNPEIRYHLAAALHQAGRDKEAASELDRALAGAVSFDGAEHAKLLRQKLR